MKTLIQTSKVLILSIAVLTAVSYVQAEWNSAPAYDPSDSGFNEDIHNAPTPINVSDSNQDKEGGFGAAALVGGIITSPEFCIAKTDAPNDCITEWPGGGSRGGDDTNVTNNYSQGQYCGYIRAVQQRGTTPYVGDGTINCTIDGVEYYPGISECKYLNGIGMQGSCTSTRKIGCPSGFQDSHIGNSTSPSLNSIRVSDFDVKIHSCIKE